MLSSNGHVTGPYSRQELMDSINDGVISSNAKIQEEGTDNWLPISVLNSLGQEPQSTTGAIVPVQYPSPYSNHPPTVYNPYYQPKSQVAAILLEILPGLCFQTFGIGNIYAGNVLFGILMMFTYWVLFVLNCLLVFVGIGIITFPITIMLYLIFGIIYAQKGVERSNWRMIMEHQSRTH